MDDANLFQMPLADAMLTQRAIRKVDPNRPVDDEILLKLIELGTHAPNSMNQQTWEFILVKDPAVKAKLGSQNRFMWNLVKGRMVKKAEKDPKFSKVNSATQWGVDEFENYPALIVACFRGPRFAYPPVLGASVYGSILPAVQNILLAARSIDLGANLTTMPLWSNWRARKILNLPFGITPCVLITLGWPLGKYGPNSRKPVGEVTSLDQYGNRPWES
jgi:nitroreductase